MKTMDEISENCNYKNIYSGVLKGIFILTILVHLTTENVVPVAVNVLLDLLKYFGVPVITYIVMRWQVERCDRGMAEIRAENTELIDVMTKLLRARADRDAMVRLAARAARRRRLRRLLRHNPHHHHQQQQAIRPR